MIANFLIYIVTSTAQTDLLRQMQFHKNFCLGLLLQAWSSPRLLPRLGPLCSFRQPRRKTRKHKKVQKKKQEYFKCLSRFSLYKQGEVVGKSYRFFSFTDRSKLFLKFLSLKLLFARLTSGNCVHFSGLSTFLIAPKYKQVVTNAD